MRHEDVYNYWVNEEEFYIHVDVLEIQVFQINKFFSIFSVLFL